MTPLTLQPIAQMSAERILNCTAEGMAIAFFSWLLLRFMGRQNSGTRFAVWFSALVAIAALPLVGPSASPAASFASHAEIALPASWASILFAVWALIASLNLARVAAGLWQLRKLKKNCVPLAVGDLDASLRKVLAEFDSYRPVTICVSQDLRMPAAIGFLKPLVVFPAWALQELSAAELHSILLHELAHLRRWDDCTNLAQKILGAVLFFHPAVWWIEGRLTLEREMACDDLALSSTQSPKAYAECLLSLAEKGFLRRGLEFVQAAVSRVHHTSLRITRILDSNRPKTTTVRIPALVLLSMFAIASTAASTYLPRLVSFENAVPTTEVAASTPGDAMSKVIPAKMTISLQDDDKAATVLVRPHKRLASPMKVAPKAAPLLVQAQVKPEIVAPQTIFVVMRTQQFRGPGSAVFTFCVWRVTLMTPAQKAQNNGTMAKST